MFSLKETTHLVYETILQTTLMASDATFESFPFPSLRLPFEFASSAYSSGDKGRSVLFIKV